MVAEDYECILLSHPPPPTVWFCLFIFCFIYTYARTHSDYTPPPTHTLYKQKQTNKKQKGWGLWGVSQRIAHTKLFTCFKSDRPAVTRSCVAMLRSFSDESRMKGCVITVDRSECYRFSKTPDSRQIHITCTTGVLNGRIINVSKCDPPDTSGLNYTINMCEFQVFSTLKFSFITPLSSNFCFVFVFYLFWFFA